MRTTDTTLPIDGAAPAAGAEWARRWARDAVAAVRVVRDEAEERRRLAEATGLRSPELLGRIHELGFDADSVGLLFLVPLVGMAGADGEVTVAERALVKELARRGGIQRGTWASAMLDGWLVEPLLGERLDRMLGVLGDVLAALPRHQADELRGRIHAALDRVGRASGGLLGFGALSRVERRFLRRIVDAV